MAVPQPKPTHQTTEFDRAYKGHASLNSSSADSNTDFQSMTGTLWSETVEKRGPQCAEGNKEFSTIQPQPVKASNTLKRTRAKKPVGMPQRPLSAYNLFFKEQRERIVHERTQQLRAQQTTDFARRQVKKAKISFEELARTISVHWKNIDPYHLQRLQTMAAVDSQRYRVEMDEYMKKHGQGQKQTKPEDRIKERNQHQLRITPLQQTESRCCRGNSSNYTSSFRSVNEQNAERNTHVAWTSLYMSHFYTESSTSSSVPTLPARQPFVCPEDCYAKSISQQRVVSWDSVESSLLRDGEIPSPSDCASMVQRQPQQEGDTNFLFGHFPAQQKLMEESIRLFSAESASSVQFHDVIEPAENAATLLSDSGNAGAFRDAYLLSLLEEAFGRVESSDEDAAFDLSWMEPVPIRPYFI